MTGLYGYLSTKPVASHDFTVREMGAALKHRPWQVPEAISHRELGGGLGRLGIGIFNKGPQPVTNDAATIALFMVGEIFNGDTADDPGTSDEQVALQAYLRDGDDFAARLNGTFSVAIWDRERNKVILANDRFGSYQHYFLVRPNCLIFAPEVKAILATPGVEAELDMTAVAQYIRFQHLLGLRTFWREIALVPPASLLVFDLRTGRTDTQTYWDFSHLDFRPDIQLDEASEEAARLLRCAVARRSNDSLRPGVYLSGGLDSRMILGLVRPAPVTSLTYGDPECLDVILAEQVARKVGSNHYHFDLSRGDWVRDYADDHLILTEGFHSWVHSHGISTLDDARRWVDVNLTGWGGGSLLAPEMTIVPTLAQAVSDSALAGSLFAKFNQTFTWPSINEAEEALLYTEATYKMIRGLAFESFRSELQPYLDLRPEMRAPFFFYRNHVGRLTQNMLKIYRSHMEVRIPYFDYDLFDFVLSLPLLLRAHSRLQRALLQRELPALTLIPYDRDEMLPTPQRWLRKSHGLGVRLKSRINKHIFPVFRERSRLYADYENYLRGELRPWAESILFDPVTAERGIFSPEYLRTLMARHVSGLEEWTLGKIAPLITLELVFRKYFD